LTVGIFVVLCKSSCFAEGFGGTGGRFTGERSEGTGSVFTGVYINETNHNHMQKNIMQKKKKIIHA
jgi:hypothetical protein